MVNFKEIYHFQRFRGGPTFSRGGGSNFFQGGPIAYSLWNPYNLWFSRGGPDPLSPLWILTCKGPRKCNDINLQYVWTIQIGSSEYKLTKNEPENVVF